MTIRRVALVTGASRGIGRAVALSFAEPGTVVVVNYRSDDTAAAGVANDVERRGGIGVPIRADVTDAGEVRNLVGEVVQRFRRIDVLVNNAGGNRDALLAMMGETEWDEVIDVNLKSVFHVTKAVARHMMTERTGAIVNVSSLSGITGLPGQANYAAAKGGVIAFTKALAQEVARFGIRVNAVAPGLVESGAVLSLPEARREQLLANVPLRRIGNPEEVASVVKFLASEGASYVTGEIIKVSGGI